MRGPAEHGLGLSERIFDQNRGSLGNFDSGSAAAQPSEPLPQKLDLTSHRQVILSWCPCEEAVAEKPVRVSVLELVMPAASFQPDELSQRGALAAAQSNRAHAQLSSIAG
jgi:hypothetical protein